MPFSNFTEETLVDVVIIWVTRVADTVSCHLSLGSRKGRDVMLQCLAWRADMRLSAVVRLPRIPARAAALHGPNAGCVSTSTVRIDWTRGFRSYDIYHHE
jgi:hypothetical protein